MILAFLAKLAKCLLRKVGFQFFWERRLNTPGKRKMFIICVALLFCAMGLANAIEPTYNSLFNGADLNRVRVAIGSAVFLVAFLSGWMGIRKLNAAAS